MIALLDTHQHLIYPERLGYSWTDDIPALADRPFTLDDYRALTKTKDVAGTLFMETGVDDADYRAEARFVAGLAADPASGIIGMIASCRPESDDGYEAWLDECTDMPVLGYRRILHVAEDDLSRSETFRANVRKLGARGLPFDMCFLAAQLPIAVELAKACADTRLILDHCGVPDIAGGGLEPWKRNISALAALPNLVCKVSGLMAYCAPGTASLETIRPYLDHVVESFGGERLLWGSDWPVVNLGGGIEGWVAVTREYLKRFSDAEAKKLAFANAARIYKATPTEGGLNQN